MNDNTSLQVASPWRGLWVAPLLLGLGGVPIFLACDDFDPVDVGVLDADRADRDARVRADRDGDVDEDIDERIDEARDADRDVDEDIDERIEEGRGSIDDDTGRAAASRP